MHSTLTNVGIRRVLAMTVGLGLGITGACSDNSGAARPAQPTSEVTGGSPASADPAAAIRAGDRYMAAVDAAVQMLRETMADGKWKEGQGLAAQQNVMQAYNYERAAWSQTSAELIEQGTVGRRLQERLLLVHMAFQRVGQAVDSGIRNSAIGQPARTVWAGDEVQSAMQDLNAAKSEYRNTVMLLRR